MGILSKLKKNKKEQEKKQEVSIKEKGEKDKEVVEKEKKPEESQVEASDKKDKKVESESLSDLKNTGNAYRVLLRPIVTEKSTLLTELGQWTFEVSWDANKEMVKDAIYKVYGIKPLKVNIIKMKGKPVQFRYRKGRRKRWKKAIVFLPKDKKLQIYEGV